MNQPEFEYLGPYRVERVLGRGGMGTVYKGVHARTGETVAIKVIARGVANQPKFIRRFDDETQTLERLKHPNIVSLKGSGEEHGYLFYVMEFVDGHSLHEHLRMRSKLPWQDVIEIGIQTASALKHAHDQGIIHRDLKPANLMLNTSGVVKLTDFGIAKLFGSSDQTAVGTVIGTADFMPPEQAEGKNVTVRSDLYSLGAVMYALLSGRAPFTGKSVPEVLYAVRYTPVERLEALVPGVPRELVELVHELLEKDPLKRPPTGLVVSNRLKALQKGLGNNHRILDDSPGSRGLNGLPGKIGPELTSLDLSDMKDDEELRLTGDSHQSAITDADREIMQTADPRLETDPSDASAGTHEQATMAAPPDHKARSRPTDEQDDSEFEVVADSIVRGQVSLVPPPKESHPEDESREAVHNPTGRRRSHYRPIEDGPLSTNYDEPTAAGSNWLHYASVAGLFGLLIITVAIGFYLVQPRDADTIFDVVEEAVDSENDGRLLAAKGDIEEFLKRFPEDERCGELEQLLNEIELTQTTHRLRRDAVKAGGSDRLSAIEQGFLDCIEARDHTPQLARDKIKAFLRVWGKDQNLTKDERRLCELAEFAEDANTPTGSESLAAAQQLEKRIEDAQVNMDGTELQEFYESLNSLYGDKTWAEKQLKALSRNIPPES